MIFVIIIIIHGNLTQNIVVLLLVLFSLNLHINILVLLQLIYILKRFSTIIIYFLIVVINYCWGSWHSWKTRHVIVVHLIVYWYLRHSRNHLLHQSMINHSSKLIETLTYIGLLIKVRISYIHSNSFRLTVTNLLI